MNNREIKFRVWCKVSNRYEYNWRKVISSHYNYRDEKITDGIDATQDDLLCFEQFTGLKDREGKEIYEGDIVQYGHMKASVIFSGGAFFVQTQDKDASLVSHHAQFILEVIGNIHQNPELLK